MWSYVYALLNMIWVHEYENALPAICGRQPSIFDGENLKMKESLFSLSISGFDAGR